MPDVNYNFPGGDRKNMRPGNFSATGAQAYGWGLYFSWNWGVYNRTCSGMMPLYNATVYTIAYTAVYTAVYTVVYTKGGHNK